MHQIRSAKTLFIVRLSLRTMFVMGVLVLSGLATSVSFAQDTNQEREILTKTDWPKVRTGQSVMALESLQRVVTRFEVAAKPVILIRFPGGNLGNAWAFELRDWFVALGIPSNQIRLEPGSGVPDGMALMVLDEA